MGFHLRRYEVSVRWDIGLGHQITARLEQPVESLDQMGLKEASLVVFSLPPGIREERVEGGHLFRLKQPLQVRASVTLYDLEVAQAKALGAFGGARAP